MGMLAAETAVTDIRFEPHSLRYVPSATYRLQLNRNFTFRDTAALLDYLHDIGISHCYTSPFLMARPGSLHGYDVTDPTRLNPEIGDVGDFTEFANQLRKRGMGLIADIVPNHMCVTHPSNRWWWDVLEDGPGSPFSRFFDIDWNPPKSELVDKILLPFLAEQFGQSLEAGKLVLKYEGDAFVVDYQGVPYPVAPRTWPVVLDGVLERLRVILGESHDYVIELESILTSISHLPTRSQTDTSKVQERRREKEVIKRRLATLVQGSVVVRDTLADVLQQINGREGDPRSFDQLEKLLDEQAYRLSHWQVAADEVNYRRFFDINELAAIRVEDSEVFPAVHALILDLVRKRQITGLRVDHPDGLFDPEQYFYQLQEQISQSPESLSTQQPTDSSLRTYLVAEKILTGNEQLRPSWEVDGTTGYGFLNVLNGVFVDKSHKRTLLRLYEQFTGFSQSFNDLLYECKHLVLQVSMSSELTALSRRLDKITEQHRWSRDFTLHILRDALQEVIACFPVYRSYIRESTLEPAEQDKQWIRQAVGSARLRNAAISGSVFDFIQNVLLLNDPEGISEVDRAVRRLFVMRFQQLTAPVMAKGLEDTAFYRYVPLLSLNEVGGSPRSLGTSVAAFHSKNAARQAMWPHSLLATSTHDHKRSEDIRARINVISEVPTDWYRAARSWQQLNADNKAIVEGNPVPGPNEEYYLYQTLMGTWPLVEMNDSEYETFLQRIHVHIEKALREAKVHTSWVSPNTAYETAFHNFLDAILVRKPDNRFLASFLPFQSRMARLGIFNSLSQLILKITSPGVPDFYQGTEVWNFTLADPDNRNPVPFAPIQELLANLRIDENANLPGLVDRLIRSPQDGGIKLFVTRTALRFREEERELFSNGSYLPLRTAGERYRHVVGFARSYAGRSVIVLAGRFFASLSSDGRNPLGEPTWRDTTVTLRRHFGGLTFRDIFTGRTIQAKRRDRQVVVEVADAFAHLPIALLAQSEGGAIGG